jgi:nucleoside-diphosphate-sugar epimerase
VKILVTGASGFIGRAVAATLYGRGYEAVGIDRHPKEIPGLASQVQGDLTNAAWMAEIMEDLVASSDGVINLAGLLGTAELLRDIRPAIEANIVAAAELMLTCRHHDKPLVQISPGNASWLSVYPITKICADRLALALGQDTGLKVAIVRAMNVYGPWQKHAPVKKYIPNLIRWALLGQPAEIYGDGEQIMDAIWVGDVAEILVRALEWFTNHHSNPPTVFEAGLGRSLMVNTVADLVWDAVQPGVLAPAKIYLPMRPGEPIGSRTVADPWTLSPLGIVPLDLRLFKDGLRETVAWYREHPEILGL